MNTLFFAQTDRLYSIQNVTVIPAATSGKGGWLSILTMGGCPTSAPSLLARADEVIE
jgi:hypothetical protein